jgi:hypothetical protein
LVLPACRAFSIAATLSSTGTFRSMRCKSQASGAEPRLSIDWLMQCSAKALEPVSVRQRWPSGSDEPALERTVHDHLAVDRLEAPLGDDEGLGSVVALAEDNSDQLLVVLVGAVDGRSVDHGAALGRGARR